MLEDILPSFVYGFVSWEKEFAIYVTLLVRVCGRPLRKILVHLCNDRVTFHVFYHQRRGIVQPQRNRFGSCESLQSNEIGLA